MNKIIAIVGMCGAGKSIASDFLVKEGYKFIRFGQITLDICKEKGVSGETAEREVREQLRKQHGMGAFATLNIPKIDNYLSTGQSVVIDGLYSWSEYKVLKEKYGDKFKVLAIWAPPSSRYQRLANRLTEVDDKDVRFRPITQEKAKERDYAEIEKIEKGGPIAMADYTVTNNSDLDNLNKQLKEILKKIADEN